jgi:hypothetical protein
LAKNTRITGMMIEKTMDRIMVEVFWLIARQKYSAKKQDLLNKGPIGMGGKVLGAVLMALS